MSFPAPLARLLAVGTAATAVAALGLPGPARAATSTLTDPSGDVPANAKGYGDIVAVHVNNRTRALAIHVRFADKDTTDKFRILLDTDQSRPHAEYALASYPTDSEHSGSEIGMDDLTRGHRPVCRGLHEVIGRTAGHGTISVTIPRRCLARTDDGIAVKVSSRAYGTHSGDHAPDTGFGDPVPLD